MSSWRRFQVSLKLTLRKQYVHFAWVCLTEGLLPIFSLSKYTWIQEERERERERQRSVVQTRIILCIRQKRRFLSYVSRSRMTMKVSCQERKANVSFLSLCPSDPLNYRKSLHLHLHHHHFQRDYCSVFLSVTDIPSAHSFLSLNCVPYSVSHSLVSRAIVTHHHFRSFFLLFLPFFIAWLAFSKPLPRIPCFLPKKGHILVHHENYHRDRWDEALALTALPPTTPFVFHVKENGDCTGNREKGWITKRVKGEGKRGLLRPSIHPTLLPFLLDIVSSRKL